MEHMVTSVIATWRAMYPWTVDFTDRELAEIALSLHYRDDFNHGTNGHNAYLVIAKLFDALQPEKKP